jgi:cyclic pyranopterin phosphate synthase
MIATADMPSLAGLLRGAALPTIVDTYGRAFTYLRISVTDLCNLRCVYCMPEEGVSWLPRKEILSYEEIVSVVEAAAACGVNKIRITGGEPLVRKSLPDLIDKIARVPGITDLSMTTNGTLLADHVSDLKAAGLRRVNVSLDTLDPEKFRRISRRGELASVLEGIAAAEAVNLSPVKLNMVVLKGINDDEIEAFAALTSRLRVQVRFIEVMPVAEVRDCAAKPNSMNHVSGVEVRARIERRLGRLLPVVTDGSHDPAQVWRIPGSTGTLGFIDAMSSAFCARCNRLRLTADGKLRSCLLQGGELDIRSILRSGDQTGSIRKRLASAFRKAAHDKPEFYSLGSGAAPGAMNRIGG